VGREKNFKNSPLWKRGVRGDLMQGSKEKNPP